jgi:positive regulator of sigma E activity
MALILAVGFRSLKSTIKLSALLFVSNFLGYFPGVALFDYLGEPTGMLLFGVVYGLLFGAGIGAALHFVQRSRES